MSSSGSTDSPQLQLVTSVVEGFNKRDMNHVASHLHKDYRSVTYPRSLGKGEQTKEEWLKETEEVVSLWTEPQMTSHSIIETQGKVVVHLTNKAKTSIGVEMLREMILIFHIVADEDGTLKFGRIEEFTDSKSYLEFFQAVATAKTNKQ